jgi:membrane protein implicated in regulation of membrane protease activity
MNKEDRDDLIIFFIFAGICLLSFGGAIFCTKINFMNWFWEIVLLAVVSGIGALCVMSRLHNEKPF